MKLFYLMFALLLFLIPLISGEQVYQQNKQLDLKVQCIINGSYCSNLGVCNVTIQYPNGSILISNHQMTNQVSFHNYTITNSSINGDYSCSATCCQGGSCGTNECSFKITPSGQIAEIGSAFLYIGLLLVLLFFLTLSIYLFVVFDNLLARVGMLGLAYLLLIAISFIGWNMANDFLLSVPFIADMFRILFFVLIIGIFPLLIGAFAWYVLMLFKIKEIQNLMDHGMSEDEARHRQGKKYKRGGW